ncbi:MAG: AAA family ATPase [Tissierellia bacterium]|nr:AAA family ATPase [Tissierellia bacterium]
MTERFKLTSFKDIEEQETYWLWRPYLPLGKLSFIAGDPGVGKSFLTTFLASVISNGEKFPFSNDNVPQGNVIIQNGEDGAGDTIKKRLVLCNANYDNIYTIELTKEHELDNNILLDDIEEIEQLLKTIKPSLMIFDPITSFLGSDTNMNAATDTRRALKPISKLAEKYNCAIVFVIHRNKSDKGGNQLYKLLGSIDLAGIARSIISVGLNVNNKEEVLFIHTKHNLSEKGMTLAFTISKEEGIIWLGTREYMEDDETLNNEIEAKPILRDVAKRFIVEYLGKNGNSKFEDIVSSAKVQSLTEKILIRARNELKGEDIIDKDYVDGNTVYWYLKEVCPDAQGD